MFADTEPGTIDSVEQFDRSTAALLSLASDFEGIRRRAKMWRQIGVTREKIMIKKFLYTFGGCRFAASDRLLTFRRFVV